MKGAKKPTKLQEHKKTPPTPHKPTFISVDYYKLI